MEQRLINAELAAKELFGYPSLRPFQRDVMSHLFNGDDTLAVASTGSGKTATFCIPALVLPGITVVVSPLVALMQGQVAALEKIGVPSCRLTGDMPDSYLNNALRDLTQFNVIYTSPEKAATKEFRLALRGKQVGLFAVDESHAIASLYSSFRASAAHLQELFDAHAEAVRLACTATADPYIEQDIVRVCGLRSPKRVVSSPWRENIEWQFVENAPQGELVKLVERYQKQPGSQIVYTSSRRETEAIAELLDSCNLSAACYHAGMAQSLRITTQDRFMSGDVKCMVATSAFGMGIDLPDIRCVAVWQMPATLFDLLQMCGRGSRDGKHALGWVNIGSKAEKTQRFFMQIANPEMRVYERLWAAFMKHDGPSKWDTDILARVAGVGETFAGQLTSALSFMEFSGAIRTQSAGDVYRMPIKDEVRANRLAAAYGAKIVNGHLLYSVPANGADNSRVFVANGACHAVPPGASVVIRRLVDELPITQDDLTERLNRAEANFRSIYSFADATDRKQFLESIMSRQ